MKFRTGMRADRVGRLIADRHYSRQSLGSPQFVPPAVCGPRDNMPDPGLLGNFLAFLGVRKARLAGGLDLFRISQ